MTASLARLWAIALNTFREAARIKVLYAIVIVVAAVNLLAIALGEMSISQQTRVARDFGIAGVSLFGSLTAIFVGIVLLYGEIQKRTIYSIISKPLARWEFVVGKYLGMVLVLTALVAAFAVAMAAVLAYQGVAISGAVAKALVLAWFEVLTVAAIAVFFSSFSSPFLSGTFALALWAIGRVTPDLRAAIASSETDVDQVGRQGRADHRPRPPRVLDLGRRRRRPARQRPQPASSTGATSRRRRRTARCGSPRCLVLACAIFRKRDFV
jgi:Cu-processing system permease protein